MGQVASFTLLSLIDVARPDRGAKDCVVKIGFGTRD